MSIQSREAKVFTALLVSMGTCALLMMVLGNNPPSAGAFSLENFCELDPVNDVITSRAGQHIGRWDKIEIRYSGTRAGNIEQLASLSGLAGPDQINCHFVICNGKGAGDGQIQPAERWQRQWAVIPDGQTSTNEKAIVILVIAGGRQNPPTDYQRKRVEQLVEELRATFDITRQSVRYPADWQ